MRHVGIGAFLLSLLCLLPASAQTAMALDGVWWQSLDDTSRVVAVASAINAYSAGFDDGAMYVHGKIEGLVQSNQGSKKLSFEQSFIVSRGLGAVVRDIEAQRLSPPYPKKFGVYAGEVTAFYEEHPNALSAQIGDVIGCLSSKPQMSCSDVAKYSGTRP